MKFLAMLKDSLREAIDAKVFYVMVGLSTVLILLALTVTFTPKAGGDAIMKAAALPLSVDLTNLETTGQDDDVAKLVERFQKNAQDLYQVTNVEPVDGEMDAPSSTFRVKIKVLQVKGLFGGTSGDFDPAARIREKFGRIGDWTIAEVVDIKPVNEGTPGLAQMFFQKDKEFEVTARPTPMAIRLWPHETSLFFGAMPVVWKAFPLGLQVFIIEQGIVGGFGAWVTLLVSVVISAFFIPNMLRKGTVDMLLVKPISRVTLMMYKYLGGLLFIAINTAVAIAGVWAALGLRTGIWSSGFLLSIPTLVFFFAILYSVSTLFAVLTRSSIVAILMTCVVWVVFFAVGLGHSWFELSRASDRITRPRALASMGAETVGLSASGFGYGPLLAASLLWPDRTEPLVGTRSYDWMIARAFAALHYVLPRTNDLDDLNKQLSFKELVFPIMPGARANRSESVSWGETLTVSGVFIALMLSLSCWRFAAKDY
jgi:ABC-type transport system involved in multi-copper enzyme maturation permease subunit